MEGLLAAVAAAGVLAALWVSATRRHLERRDHRTDWDDADTVPRLWTSTARCPHCRADGGVLSTAGDELWFTCLSCGQRHRRETKT